MGIASGLLGHTKPAALSSSGPLLHILTWFSPGATDNDTMLLLEV